MLEERPIPLSGQVYMRGSLQAPQRRKKSGITPRWGMSMRTVCVANACSHRIHCKNQPTKNMTASLNS